MPYRQESGPVHSTPPMRGGEVDLGTDRNDAGRVDRGMAGVVVPLDMLQVDRIRNARHLVELAGVGPEVGEVHQALEVALEVADVDGVETHQGGEQPPVGFGNAVTNQ